MKLFKMLFLGLVTFSSLMAISSFSWFSMWMGLEINLLSIIPLMNSNKNLYPSEASIKYFITQTVASSVILTSVLMSLNMMEFIPLDFSLYLNIMLSSGFFMKMGAAPFHFWFPEIMEGLDWMLGLIMLTWQKIAPMILLLSNLHINLFICIIALYSSLVSGIQGLNQVSIRKILAYSSINHIGWMLGSMMFSNLIWTLYFLTYVLISINLVLILKSLKIFFLKQLFNSLSYLKFLKILFSLNFLSLGGLPPFLGFMPKWLTISFLVQNNLFLVTAILIILTLTTLYYYLRITSNSLVMYSSEVIFKRFNADKWVLSFNSAILMGLLLCSFFLNS